MSTQRPSSAGTSSQDGKCTECVRKRERGHKNAREPKFCQRHQCVDVDSSGVMCTTRKKAADIRCPSHTKCKAHRCPNARSLDAQGIPNDYCFDHVCAVENCPEGRVHDPRRNVYDTLCATHLSSKCAVTSCLNWKTETSRFCESHICIIEHCNSKVISESRPFCLDHNGCRVNGCSKERCQFGNHFESVCLDHYVAPCDAAECNQKSSAPSPYCDLHACRYQNCVKDARPGRGKPFCIDHRCTDVECQLLRTFSEVDRKLRKNAFCSIHECKTEGCVKHTYPDKPYCNSHYCTKQGCKAARDRDPRCATLCYTHHEDRIREAAIRDAIAAETRLNEERAQREAHARAHAETQARAEQARRQQQPMPHRPNNDHLPRQDDRRYDIPDPRRHGRQAGVWAEREYPSEEEYEDEDEGYRSRPASGAYGAGVRGW